MGKLDELLTEQQAQRAESTDVISTWLRTLDDDERAEWEEVLAASAIQHAFLASRLPVKVAQQTLGNIRREKFGWRRS